MTEAEWLTCTDPQTMLSLLTGMGEPAQVFGVDYPNTRISDRKLRLFACACLRLPPPFGTVDADLTRWDLLAIDAAEVLADDPWHQTAEAATLAGGKSDKQGVLWLSERNGEYAAREWTRCGGRTAAFIASQAALLRDIAGNPFRPVPDPRRDPYNPHVSWLTPTVVSLARTAYEERPGRVCGECAGSGLNVHVASSADRCPDCHGTGRIDDGSLDPQRLAVLSDALEEAGCQSEEILRHLKGQERCLKCRGTGLGGDNYEDKGRKITCMRCCNRGLISQPGPHVRGCHVLDLLLGKE